MLVFASVFSLGWFCNEFIVGFTVNHSISEH